MPPTKKKKEQGPRQLGDESPDESEELEDILEVLSNHLRRKIIRSLAREDSYMAALAQEVETSPQALVKHLNVLKRKGIIREDSKEDIGEDESLRVRAGGKEDKKIKYYSLNKSVNLRINFGLGVGLEIQGQAWDADELEERRTEVREEYKKLLNEFVSLEDYIRKQMSKDEGIDDRLKNMNDLLDKFDTLEQFFILERQIIMIRKLKEAVSYLSDEQCQELRPMFFELLSAIDLDKKLLSDFKKRVHALPETEASKVLGLLGSNER